MEWGAVVHIRNAGGFVAVAGKDCAHVGWGTHASRQFRLFPLIPALQPHANRCNCNVRYQSAWILSQIRKSFMEKNKKKGSVRFLDGMEIRHLADGRPSCVTHNHDIATPTSQCSAARDWMSGQHCSEVKVLVCDFSSW